jgi:biopolymer transport protein ExbD
MAGHASNGRNGLISGINVTPFVDVVLVLLVIFIVTAKILVMPAVPMDFPEGGQTTETAVLLAVAVPLEGSTRVNGRPMASDEALIRETRDAVAGDKDLRVVIQADGRVSHERVMHVLGLLRDAGAQHVAFAAKEGKLAR